MSAEARAARTLADVADAAAAPFGQLSKAAACSAGLADRLAWALSLRNRAPDDARIHIIGALAAWPIVCRVMAELEAAVPDLAELGSARAEPILAMLDRRDGR